MFAYWLVQDNHSATVRTLLTVVRAKQKQQPSDGSEKKSQNETSTNAVAILSTKRTYQATN